VIHDGKRGLEAALDIDFLHGTLIHVGIFLDGFNQIGDARGAVLELLGDAFHFEEGGEASELRAKRLAGGRSEGGKLGIGKALFRERWRKLPGVGDIALFEPGLNDFFAFDTGKFILELRGLK